MTVDSRKVQPVNDTESNLRELIGSGLETDKSLAPLTSLGTGGPARFFFEASSAEELTGAVGAAAKCGLDFFLIGGGSNLLVSDEGFDGLVIKVNVRGLAVSAEGIVTCGAGVDLSDLVQFCVREGLTGLEFAAGIWGTVGGAIYGNAGAYGGQIGDIVRRARLIDRDGQIKDVDREYCQFGYRDSYLKKSREIVVEVDLALTPGDHRAIKERVDEILQLRQVKFPPRGTAGCFFKNIPDPSQPHGKLPAGKLLEEAGAKQLRVGKARVFEGHANIIVAEPGATSKEVRELADKMKETVKAKFGIKLEEEIVSIGRF